ncbi:MAG: 50S ribosomal protein L1 [Planctomycetaceae bacterium]|nr:50S ribosomal protein L1 [Planctomycetaceae bacterium]
MKCILRYVLHRSYFKIHRVEHGITTMRSGWKLLFSTTNIKRERASFVRCLHYLPKTFQHKVMAKHSKRYRNDAKKTSKIPVALPDAVDLLKRFDTTKFNQSVDISVRLGIDLKQSDQNVRGSIVLPHGIGKSLRVCVIAKGEKAEEAKNGGADVIGDADLVAKIKDGWTDFDICIATPDVMGLVGPLGKVLGPRGLMPSPRAGTVTMEVAKTIKEYKAGKVEVRSDKLGIVHSVVGKIKFDKTQLIENIEAFLQYLQQIKPVGVKGQFVKSITLSGTMSPGVAVILS